MVDRATCPGQRQPPIAPGGWLDAPELVVEIEAIAVFPNAERKRPNKSMFLYSFPSIVLKSSASAIDAKQTTKITKMALISRPYI
jgi:hypothetical protein